MNINKGKLTASLIATSIVLPMSSMMVHADEDNIEQINIDENIEQINTEENIQPINIEYKIITGNSVNFRKGPSSSHASIGKLNKGNKVEYIAKSGSWVNVKYNGNVGYVHSDYVASSNDNSSNNNNSNNNSDNTIKSTKVVTGGSVNLRSGPSTSYSKITTLSKGAEVGFISESNGWAKVSYNGKIGHMSGQYLSNKGETVIPNPEVPNTDNTVKSTKVVTGGSVNLRSGPSTSYSKITTLSKGTDVGFISESNGWAKINYNGKIGYMSSKYLTNKGATPNPEVPNTDNTVKSTKVVTGGSVNLRSGAGTSYSKVATLSKGTEVGFISESNGWTKINYNGKIGFMSSQYVGDKTSISVPSGSNADKVIDLANTLLGKKYVWGAEGPNTFDCSGFTQYVFKKSAGVSIPRVSRDQSKFGQSVSRSQLQKGDLIFFDTDGSNNGNVTHVAIYMGNNKIIHASSSQGKVLTSEMNSYYDGAFINARRVL